MSRKIKFRALKENQKEYIGGWNGNSQDNAKWVYGSGIVPVYINTYLNQDMLEMVVDVNYDELDYWQPSYSNCKIIPNTVCQYINIEDKNKNEIYEGDIVRIDGEKENFLVVWVCDTARFGLQSKTQLLYFEPFYGSRIEVIGNKYENPELTQE